MLTQSYYLLQAKADGRYMTANPSPGQPQRYLLLFYEHSEALSYLNQHAADLANQFTVDSMTGSQIQPILKRWGFGGIALINDPLIPQIEFMTVS